MNAILQYVLAVAAAAEENSVVWLIKPYEKADPWSNRKIIIWDEMESLVVDNLPFPKTKHK